MAKSGGHLMDEADIGSGEKTPGEEEVQRDVESVKVPPVHHSLDGSQLQEVVEEQTYAEQRHLQSGKDAQANMTERILKSGTHLARITTQQQPDGTYEAQVFVRLAREPELAETYIPAGIHATEAEAWTAAEERATRALKEREF